MLFIVSLKDVKQFKNMSIALSGHSTRSNAKLSYKLKIDKNDGTLYDYRRLKLRSMSMDTTYMKEVLAYDIANKMGLPTSQNSYVRVYFNERPIGLFGLVEIFKNPWPRNVFANGKKYNQGAVFVADGTLGASVQTVGAGGKFPGGEQQQQPEASNSSTTGNTLSGYNSSLAFLGNNVTLYEAPYSLKEDPSVGTANFTRIMELTRFISQQPNNTMVDDSHAEAWEKMLDVESTLRSLALEVLISNMDGYMSMANNYVLYDDLENERLVMSAQDLDLTMGIVANEPYVTGNYSKFEGFSQRPLTTTLFKVPKFKQRFEDILYNTTVRLVNPNVLYPRIDALSGLLAQDVEWDKSLPRVTNSTFDFTSYVPFSIAVNGSVAEFLGNGSNPLGDVLKGLGLESLFLKEWIKLRSDNIYGYFNGSSNMSTSA